MEGFSHEGAIQFTSSSTKNMRRFDVKVELFGSRRYGNPRPESDWDLLIDDPASVDLLPMPVPQDFYCPTVDGHDVFHRQRRTWSRQAWNALGGTEGISQLIAEATERYASAYNERIRSGVVEAFLYLPPSASASVFAVALRWDVFAAQGDFFEAAYRKHGTPFWEEVMSTTSASLTVQAQDESQKAHQRRLCKQAVARAKELKPAEFPTDWREVSSMPVIMRSFTGLGLFLSSSLKLA